MRRIRRYLDDLLNSCHHALVKPACRRKRVLSAKGWSNPWFEQLEDRIAPASNIIDWADWTSAVVGQPGSAHASITVPNVNPITVSYSGEVTFADTDNSGGPQYWVPNAPYLSQTIGNTPTSSDIVALSGGNTTVDTLTFSQPVIDPILGIVSLGNNGLTATYAFNAPFNILSFGPGYFGGPGTLTQLPGNVLSGVEGHGAIQFKGTFTSLHWTDPTYEYWSGFTVGLPQDTNAYLPPVAHDDQYGVGENVALHAGTQAVPGVLANDSSTPGHALTASKVDNPSHGILIFNPDGSFVYTPATQFIGTDSFTYKFNDGTTDSNVATVNLRIGLLTSIATKTSQPVAYYGTPVTFSATVNSPSGTPTGAVEFFDDTTGLDVGAGTLTSSGAGSATWTYAAQPGQLQQTNGNADVIRAAFTGTNNFIDGSENLIGGETVLRQSLGVSGVTANNKVYDGTNKASFDISAATLGSIVPGDTVSLSEIDGFFARQDVGNAIAVTATKLVLAGAHADDYAPYVNQPAPTANITPAPLTITGLTANDKNYDGATTATFSDIYAPPTLSGVIGADAVSFGSVTGSFASNQAGKNIPITGLNVVLSGAQANDYTPTLANAPLTANISPEPLTIIQIVADKKYDGTTQATITPASATLLHVVSGDSVSLVLNNPVGTFASKDAALSIPVSLTGVSLQGPQANDYLFTPTTNATIAPLPVPISGITANDKVYNHSTSATLSTAKATVSSVVPGDSVSVAQAFGSFTSRDAGTAIPVMINSITLTGPQAGDYAAVPDQAPLAANITPALITVAGIVADKVYDGTTRAIFTLRDARLLGVFTGDTVSAAVTNATGSFPSKDVGTNIPINLSGVTLGGRQASDYVLSPTTTANITPAPLTVTGITANDKTYDGTKAATLDTSKAALVGVFGTDNVSLDASGATGTFVGADAGTDKTVQVSGLTLTGPQANDYEFQALGAQLPAGVVAYWRFEEGAAKTAASGANSILDSSGNGLNGTPVNGPTYQANVADSPIPQTGAPNKLALDFNGYGQFVTIPDNPLFQLTHSLTLEAYVNLAAIQGYEEQIVFRGDDFGGLDPYLLQVRAGMLALRIEDDSGNEIAVSYPFAPYVGKWVHVAGTLDGTTGIMSLYIDGSLVATNVTSIRPYAVLVGPNPGLGIGNTESPNYSEYFDGLIDEVRISNQALKSDQFLDAPRYQDILSANITPAPLTITGVTAKDKTYDGTTAATFNTAGATLVGLVSGDAVSISAVTGSFASKDAAPNVPIAGFNITLTGPQANDYTPTLAIAPLTANITPAPLTIIQTVADKPYDGTTQATITPASATVEGVLTGDSVRLVLNNPVATFTSKDAGLDIPVSLTGFSLQGPQANDYALPMTTHANISRLPLLISTLAANDKTYDRTTLATLSAANASLQGLLPGDAVSVQAIGTFASRDAGMHILVTLGNVSLGGPQGIDYARIAPQTTWFANIAPAPVTVAGLVADKVYDGTTNASLTPGSATPVGVFNGDTVSLVTTNVTGLFTSKDAGTNIPVNLTGIALGGQQAGDYALTPTTTATITPAPLSVSGIIANDKVYDGTKTATLDTKNAVLVGVLGNDDVTLNAAAARALFTERGHGANIPVRVAGLTLNGLQADDYTIPEIGAPDPAAEVAYWRFEEGAANAAASGVNSILDSSGHDLNGTAINGPTYQANVGDNPVPQTGAANNLALNFNGSSQFVTIPDSPLFQSDQNLTLEAYIDLRALPGYVQQIVFRSDDQGRYPYFLAIVGGNLDFRIADANANPADVYTPFAPTYVGQWTHVAGTFDSSTGTMSVYINGTLAATNTTSVRPYSVLAGPNPGIGIGNAQSANRYQEYFDGLIDEVRISNQALKPTQFLDSPSVQITTRATITAKVLTLPGPVIVNDKVYDGTTGATLNPVGGTLAGVLPGDIGAVNAVAAFTSKDVGRNIAVTGPILIGAKANDYVLAFNSAPLTGDIAPAPLTVRGLTANNKVYDGTSAATLNIAGASLAGILNSDTVTLNSQPGTATFASKNVGVGIPVNVTGLTLSGAQANDYVIAQPVTSANIMAAPLTITAVANTKTYDGTASATAVPAVTGLVGGDSVTNLSEVYDNANPGSDKTLSVYQGPTPSATLGWGLSVPDAITFDMAGNLYVANAASGVIYKFAPGASAPSAALTGLVNPSAMAFDSSGNLYVINGGDIRLTGIGNAVSRFAPGAATPNATLTGLNSPSAMAFDSSGNLYVANLRGNSVSKFAPGAIAPEATLTGLPAPRALAVDGKGDLFVANSTRKISKFASGATTPTSSLTTVYAISALAIDASGNLYVVSFNGNTASLFAPGATTPSATLTGLVNPRALAFDHGGNIYVANNNNTLSKFNPGSKTPSTIIAGLSNPRVLALDSNGNLFVANASNGTVSEFAGAAAIGATLAGLSSPQAMAFDAAGDLYVANGTSNTVSEFVPGSTTPSATLTGLSNPDALAFDNAGNLYVANVGNRTANYTVSKFAPGATTPSATLTGLNYPVALASDALGNLYVANQANNTVSKFGPGAITPTATLGGLNRPNALAFDKNGNLYVANNGNNTVSEFAPNTTTAGTILVGLSGPSALAFDNRSNLYVGNTTTNTVSEFFPGATTPSVTFIGLTALTGLAIDRQDNLYVGNSRNNTVSKFTPGLPPGYTINDGNGGKNYSVTLVNNTTGVIRPPLSVSITAKTSSLTEPAPGTTAPYYFTIALNGVSPKPVTVYYQTRNGSAQAGEDYRGVSNYRVTFPAFAHGATASTPPSMDVAITVNGDTADGTDPETFSVVLTSAFNAMIDAGGKTATGTIVQSTASPATTASIADFSVAGPSAGTMVVYVPVTLNGPAAQAITVYYSTTDGTPLRAWITWAKPMDTSRLEREIRRRDSDYHPRRRRRAYEPDVHDDDFAVDQLGHRVFDGDSNHPAFFEREPPMTAGRSLILEFSFFAFSGLTLVRASNDDPPSQVDSTANEPATNAPRADFKFPIMGENRGITANLLHLSLVSIVECNFDSEWTFTPCGH